MLVFLLVSCTVRLSSLRVWVWVYLLQLCLFCHVISASGTVLSLFDECSRELLVLWPCSFLIAIKNTKLTQGLFCKSRSNHNKPHFESQGYRWSLVFFSPRGSLLNHQKTIFSQLKTNWENIVQFTSMSRGIKRRGKQTEEARDLRWVASVQRC